MPLKSRGVIITGDKKKGSIMTVLQNKMALRRRRQKKRVAKSFHQNVGIPSAIWYYICLCTG